MNNFFRSISFYLLIIILVLSLVQWYSSQEAAQLRIGYSELIQLIDNGQVSKIKIVENNISGTKGRTEFCKLCAGCYFFYGEDRSTGQQR